MDTPQGEVSWLESFQPDIWSYIACYLPGEQLGRLMMTGARSLWQQLKLPTVVKSINLGQDFLIFNSLPRFLNDFPSLEKLSIHSYSDKWSKNLGLMFDSIPSGVRKLEFTGFWDGAPVGEREGNSLFEHLPHLEVLDVRPLTLAQCSTSWMSHSPRSLTNLRILFWGGTVELPSTLIHFWAQNVAVSNPSFVSKLPPLLESFVVSSSFHGFELVVPLLSPSMCKLSLGYSDIDLAISPESLTFLPTNLTELTLSSVIPSSRWSFLPQNLQKLSFTMSESQCATVTRRIVDSIKGISRDVTTYPFELLPQSLTYLSFYIEDMSDSSYGLYLEAEPDPTAKPLLPPRLTTLKSQDMYYSPNAAKHLPSSLTHLEIENLSETIGVHLPKGLTYLSAYQTLMSPELIRLLPKSLFTLQLYYAHQDSHWFDFSTGEGRRLSECPELPIHMNLTEVDWRMDVSFPPNLTSLKLANFKDLGHSPRNFNLFNLLSLNMGSLEQFSDADTPLLNRHLVSLSLTRCTKVSGKSFPVLPRSLTYLELRCSSLINDDDIQHLPRTLEEAFFCSATSLTNRCIIDFPRQLRKLDLSMNKIITEDCIPDLPYPIRSVDANFSLRLARWGIKSGKIQRKI